MQNDWKASKSPGWGLEGIDSAYIVHPMAPGLLQPTAHFVQAAKEPGPTAIVNMLHITARREAERHAAPNRFAGGTCICLVGLPVTHLRPTFYAEWSVGWAASCDSHHALLACLFNSRRMT